MNKAFPTRRFFIAIALALSSGSAAPATVLCGVVTGTLTSAGNPWVVTCNSVVNPADTVLVGPGVEILFEAGVELDIQGALIATGTAAEPIIIQSAAPVPAAGDYGTIDVSGSAELTHTTLRHGTGWRVSGELAFDQGEVQQQLDADTLAALVFSPGSKATVTASFFDNPGRPVAMAENVEATFADLEFASGHLARSILVGGGTWNQSHTWTAAGQPYEIAGTLQFDPGAIQTFEPGVLFKIRETGSLLFQDVDSLGTVASFVIFTSIDDDSFGGDTYGDGAGAPAAGDYPQIQINGTANLAGTLFRYGEGIHVSGHADIDTCVIDRQRGYDSLHAALSFGSSSSGSVNEVILDDNHRPVRLDPGADVTLDNLYISNHVIDSIAIVGGSWNRSREWTDQGVAYELGGPFGDVRFDPGTVQTVDPGVVFKIPWGHEVSFDGLQINGTAENPVVFTAQTDDDYGGDTYGDGPQPTAAGDYGLIEICGTASIDHTTFRYGSGVRVKGHADFDRVTVEKQDTSSCPTAGIEFYDVATGSVTDSHFSETCLPVSFWKNANPDLAGITVESQLFADAVMLDGGGTWSIDRTWTDPGLPYYVWGSIDTSGVVHIVEPGTVFKFAAGFPSTSFSFDDDMLHGTAERPIVFTSFADDSVGGDTNLDGLSSGAAGDWVGLQLFEANTIRHVEVRYAQTGLLLAGPSSPGFVTENVFRHNWVGLDVDVTDAYHVTDNQFLSNDIGVSIEGGGYPKLGDLADGDPNNDGRNQFACNVIHVENVGPLPVKAENNWWGQAPPSPSLFGGLGPVDADPHWFDPGPVPLTRLLLDRVAGTDVALTWDDVAPSCGYRVLRSTGASTGFTDISGPIATASFLDAGAALTPDVFFYLVTIE